MPLQVLPSTGLGCLLKSPYLHVKHPEIVLFEPLIVRVINRGVDWGACLDLHRGDQSQLAGVSVSIFASHKRRQGWRR